MYEPNAMQIHDLMKYRFIHAQHYVLDGTGLLKLVHSFYLLGVVFSND